MPAELAECLVAIAIGTGLSLTGFAVVVGTLLWRSGRRGGE